MSEDLGFRPGPHSFVRNVVGIWEELPQWGNDGSRHPFPPPRPLAQSGDSSTAV